MDERGWRAKEKCQIDGKSRDRSSDRIANRRVERKVVACRRKRGDDGDAVELFGVRDAVTSEQQEAGDPAPREQDQEESASHPAKT